MKSKTSKNNPDNRQTKNTIKTVISDDCEKCINKCENGIAYLKRFKIKHEGNGVICKRVN